MVSLIVCGIPLLAAFAGLIWLMSRKRLPAAPKPAGRAPERVQKERELLDRLERLKSKTDSVSAAVSSDPARAAGAVRAMMKERNGKQP